MIECIAWDLIGKHSDKVDNGYMVRVAGGRTFYQGAYYVKSEQSVRLSRFDDKALRLRVIDRYIAWDQAVELVPTGEQTC